MPTLKTTKKDQMLAEAEQYIDANNERSVIIGALSYSDRPDITSTSYGFGADWIGTLSGGSIRWRDHNLFEVIFNVTLADPALHPSCTNKNVPLTTRGSRWAIRGNKSHAVVFQDAPAATHIVAVLKNTT